MTGEALGHTKFANILEARLSKLPDLRFTISHPEQMRTGLNGATMRWISSALLLASLLIGLAHVAALPPFEGIDETAHYSYVEQIAKTGTLPRFGDKIRQDVQDVWDSLFVTPAGPRIRSLRYRNLFTADAEIIKTARQAVKAPHDPPPTGEPGSIRN